MNPQAYGMYPPPPRTANNRTLAIVLCAVALIVAGLIVVGVFAFKAGAKSVTAATRVSDAFLLDLKSHNYKAARTMIAPAALPKATVKDMKALDRYIQTRYGSMVSTGTPAWYINSYNGQTTVRLTYPVQYSNGSGTILVVLIRTSRGYQVISWNYQ